LDTGTVCLAALKKKDGRQFDIFNVKDEELCLQGCHYESDDISNLFVRMCEDPAYVTFCNVDENYAILAQDKEDPNAKVQQFINEIKGYKVLDIIHD